jgi:5-(carboxyamino)imidazole ribonucleotide synthase
MDAARQMMSNIGDYVGLIVIEMFRGKDGKLYINEFAPRPHNSLHATL